MGQKTSIEERAESVACCTLRVASAFLSISRRVRPEDDEDDRDELEATREALAAILRSREVAGAMEAMGLLGAAERVRSEIARAEFVLFGPCGSPRGSRAGPD